MHANPELKALLEGLHYPNSRPIVPGLERIKELLAEIGNPEKKLPPVIHVAGTNGKGSVCANLTAIMQSAGLRVHRYTSPHLVCFNERIMVADGDITDDRLITYLKRLQPILQNKQATFFVATTAIAYLAFSEVEADICILETGMGGRWDATNVINTPLLTIITSISKDHMKYLGETLTKIAFEKSGIMKYQVPCIISKQQVEALKEIKKQADNKNTPLWVYGEDWSLVDHDFVAGNEIIPLSPRLVGQHQLDNAATSLAAAKKIQMLKPEWNLTNEHMQKGIQKTQWPARLQQLYPPHLYAKLLPKASLWLDGGHNEDAAHMLAHWLENQPKPRAIICGMLAEKDAEPFVKRVSQACEEMILIDGFTDTETYAKEDLIQFVYSPSCAQISPSIQQAIEMLSEKNIFQTVLICGSLYLAGHVLSLNPPGT